jgi:hypothetical protein
LAPVDSTPVRFGIPDAKLLMTEEQFRQVLSPEFMIRTLVRLAHPKAAVGLALSTLLA